MLCCAIYIYIYILLAFSSSIRARLIGITQSWSVGVYMYTPYMYVVMLW